MPNEENRFYPFSRNFDYSEDDFETMMKFNFLYWKRGNYTWGTTTHRGVTCWNPPTDLWSFQEIIQEQKPKLVVECGTGCGGTSLWLADVMKRVVPDGRVVTIDISREHLNTAAIDVWNELGNVEYLEGSSISEPVLRRVKSHVDWAEGNILVILDSDHTYPHPLRELEVYSTLVKEGNYIVVCDTMVPGPRDSVKEFLESHKDWSIDPFSNRYMLSFCFGGFLVHSNPPPAAVLSIIGINSGEGVPPWYSPEEWGRPDGFGLSEKIEIK